MEWRSACWAGKCAGIPADRVDERKSGSERAGNGSRTDAPLASGSVESEAGADGPGDFHPLGQRTEPSVRRVDSVPAGAGDGLRHSGTTATERTDAASVRAGTDGVGHSGGIAPCSQ